MVVGKSRMVNSKFLLQFAIYPLPFNFYEAVHLFTFILRLFPCFVPPVRHAAFDFKQTRFDKRHSADQSADAAVKTFDGNVLDKF